MNRISMLSVIAVAAVFSLGGQTWADYSDDFDGTSSIVWTNAADDGTGDLGGNIVFDGSGTATATGANGRRVYAYFDITPADVAAGYTVTVKGKGLGGGGDQDPCIGLLFGGSGVWTEGNWWYTSNGANHMYGSTDAGAAGYVGGGPAPTTGQDYYLRATVAAGGLSAQIEASFDNTTWRDFGTKTAVAYGTKVGIMGSAQSNAVTGFDWITVDVVPEPTAMTLLALGGLAALARRKKK